MGTALEVMRTNGIRHLPVVDETGLLVGIVTDRDLRHAVLAPALEEFLPVRAQRHGRQIARAVENLRVRDVMTWAVVTTTPEAPMLYAAMVRWRAAWRRRSLRAGLAGPHREDSDAPSCRENLGERRRLLCSPTSAFTTGEEPTCGDCPWMGLAEGEGSLLRGWERSGMTPPRATGTETWTSRRRRTA